MKLRGERFLLIWALFAMSRPAQLVLIAFVYLFGSVISLANGVHLNVGTFWMGLLALLPLSASVHYANEYADHETDARTMRTPFSGGSGALLRTGLHQIVALRAAWIAAVVGALIAFIAFERGFLSPSAFGILTLGTFFGWMYSLKPLALGWRGLGELDNALLGGVMLPLYGYVAQEGNVDAWVIMALLPFGASVFINLLATTWPDRVADEMVGKRTLATRLPVQYLRLLYWSVALGIVLSLFLLLHRVLPLSVVAGSLLTAPVILWGGLRYTRQHSPFPTVAAMVLLLFAQTIAWWSSVDFCCLFGPV
jgi:1,4-dihydroxy-2-naphthoate octaprenyltransferase